MSGLTEFLDGLFSSCTFGLHKWKYIEGHEDPDDETGHTRTPREVCQRCYAFRYVNSRRPT